MNKARMAVAGFTLIEIVMVLVLLGILSAVAVPKYFDLQEEAIAKKCQHNRGVVQSAVIAQFAAAQLDGVAGTTDWKINEVMKDLDGCTNHSVCQKLCEAGGQYDVEFDQTDGNLVVTVGCLFHTGDGGEPGKDTTKTAVNPSAAYDFMKWFKEAYSELLPGADKNTDRIASIEDFFTEKNKTIDSEADGFFNGTYAGGNYSSMTAPIKEMLEKAGFDTDNIVWKLTREETSGDGKTEENGFQGKLVLRIASVSKEQKDAIKNSTLDKGSVFESNVNVWKYSIDFKYGKNDGKDAFGRNTSSAPIKWGETTMTEEKGNLIVSRDDHQENPFLTLR